MTAGPSLTYAQIITALEGPGRVGRWQELAAVLERRPGWFFTIEEGFAVWQHEHHLPGGPSSILRWASLDVVSPRFVLYRALAADNDEVAYWEFERAEDFAAEVTRQDAGRVRYDTRTGGWGRWDVPRRTAAAGRP